MRGNPSSMGAPTASFSFLGAILVFTALATLGNI